MYKDRRIPRLTKYPHPEKRSYIERRRNLKTISSPFPRFMSMTISVFLRRTKEEIFKRIQFVEDITEGI